MAVLNGPGGGNTLTHREVVGCGVSTYVRSGHIPAGCPAPPPPSLLQRFLLSALDGAGDLPELLGELNTLLNTPGDVITKTVTDGPSAGLAVLKERAQLAGDLVMPVLQTWYKIANPIPTIFSYAQTFREGGFEAVANRLATAAGHQLIPAVLAFGGVAGAGALGAVDSESEFVNLAGGARTRHILEGDATGGGHEWPGLAGKSPFPSDWSSARIMHEISNVATDPAAWNNAVSQGGRTILTGIQDGVEIKVIVDSRTGEIISGYPTNSPRNP